MKILLDTNILLEHLIKRDNFRDVTSIINLCFFDKNIIGLVSDKSILDTHYIGTRHKELLGEDYKNKIINFLKILTRNLIIIGGNNEIFSSILNELNIIKDFEDNFQYQVAKENNIDAIVTLNKKDFQNSKIKVYSPREFLNSL